MHLLRRFRLPALFCAAVLLLCEWICRPYASMGIGDDGPYIYTARTLADTGRVVYEGWATAMLLGQIYLAEVFIKLFGFSFTTVRMSTLCLAAVTAFILQRILVRCDITERNATLGTLALTLSPLYFMLSVSFMSDIAGLFGVVACLYGCLRAVQASTSRAAIGWLGFAVVTNAFGGSARQIAWLGILVMVPSTLWLLRTQRRVLIAGAAFTLASVVFIFACMQWFKRQPYSIPEHLFAPSYPILRILREFFYSFLNLPFLMLPLVALFLPRTLKCRPLVLAAIPVALLGFFFLAYYPSHLRGIFTPLLQPSERYDLGLNPYGFYAFTGLKGEPPLFLGWPVQVLLTLLTFGGGLGLVLMFYDRKTPSEPSQQTSWRTLGIMLVPFSVAYLLLLVPRATTYTGIYERYALVLLLVALPCLVRFYQEQIQLRLPFVCALLIGAMAVCSMAVTHNTFAISRARVALAAELRSHGVPDTSVDSGWEYNFDVELQHADHINWPMIEVPAHAYVPRPPLPVGSCWTVLIDPTPHIQPVYAISFDPKACYGQAPFAPVHYSRWLASHPGTLYVVHAVPPQHS